MFEKTRKWVLKNGEASVQRIAEGILILVIYQWSPWLIKHFTSLSSSIANKTGSTIGKVLEYEVTVSVSALTLSMLISLVSITSFRKAYRLYQTKNSKFKVLEATYFTQKNSVDITNELNQAIVNDRLKINLTNDIAGDPDKGTNKEGVVRYSHNGREFQNRYKEWDLIDLPPATGK